MSVQIRKEAAASSAASAAAAVLPVSIKDHAATTTTPSSWASRIISREVLFVVSVLGVYACHLSFSLVQERVTRGVWGLLDERWTFVYVMLTLQAATNAVFALLAMVMFPSTKNTAPMLEYMGGSVSYIAAMCFANLSLQYVSYPMQALAKSCKPIPVMIMQVIVIRRSYHASKYLLVCVLCVGIMLFVYNPEVGSGSISALGSLYLALSLLCDAFTGPLQERLVRNYGTSSLQLMLYSNFWGMIFVAIAALMTNEFPEAYAFCHRNPDIVVELLLYSLLSAFGQFFIFILLRDFGSLVVSIVTTSRKFFTLLASVLYYGHAISPIQWLGVSLVFAGLGADITTSYNTKKPHQSSATVTSSSSSAASSSLNSVESSNTSNSSINVQPPAIGKPASETV